MSVLSVNKANFNTEVIASTLPVLIDFWAPWCGPCRMLGPTVDEIAAENVGRVKVVKVNVDEEPELARQFKVMSIPTLVVMRNGAMVANSLGVQSKQAILQMLSK